MSFAWKLVESKDQTPKNRRLWRVKDFPLFRTIPSSYLTLSAQTIGSSRLVRLSIVWALDETQKLVESKYQAPKNRNLGPPTWAKTRLKDIQLKYNHSLCFEHWMCKLVKFKLPNSEKLQVGALNLSSSTSLGDFFLQLKQNYLHSVCFWLINHRTLRWNVQPFLGSAFDGPQRRRTGRGEVEQYSETAATEHPRAWCGRGGWVRRVPKTTKLSTGLHIGHRSHSLQDGGCTDREVQAIPGSLSRQQGGVCPTRENTWGVERDPHHHTGRKLHHPWWTPTSHLYH